MKPFSTGITKEQFIFSLSLVLCGGLVAGIMATTLLSGNLKIIIGAVAAILGVMGLSLSGNPRLFCLWGLMLTFPLELKKSFSIVPHMGGAAAISIEAIDVFLLPLCLFIFRDIVLNRREKLRVPKVLYWWFGLMFMGMIDIAVGPMRHVAALEVIRMLKLSILFLVIVNEVVRVRQFGHIIAALMIGVALQSVVGLIQYAFDLNLGLQMLGEVTKEGAEFTSKATYMEGTFTYRVGGLIGHPNLLAIYLAMLLPIGIAVLLSSMKNYYKIIAMGIIIMGLMVLVLTLSRSGWLSFSAAFLFIFILSYIHPQLKRQYRFGKVVIVVLLIVMMVALSPFIIKRLTKSDKGAVDFRWEWMEVSLKMAADKPIAGFGLNSFVWMMPEYTTYNNYRGVIKKFGTDLPVVHNVYLLTLAEQGLVGLFLYLGFYIHLMRIGWQGVQRYRDPFLTLINIGCTAALIALAIDSMASFFIRNGNGGRTFIIIAALLSAMQYWHYVNTTKKITATDNER